MLLKLMLFIAAVAGEHRPLPLLLTAVVIGGVSSHMPGKYRYFSPLHGRVVKQ